MSPPNLHQFILSARNRKIKAGSCRAWVNEPKFEGLYVRYTRRAIRSPENAEMKVYEDVLDIANVTVKPHHQRRGVFTALIQRVRETYPDVGIYVENARPDTLEPLLKRLGFQIAHYSDLLGQHSWFLPPITGHNP